MAREDAFLPKQQDRPLAFAILGGEAGLASPGLLAELRQRALEKLGVDVPKYPALAVARKKWTGEE